MTLTPGTHRWFTLLALVPLVNAAAAPFPTGANTLIAGHSFFASVTDDFNEIATENGYADHHVDLVMSGAQSGSPRFLWQNEQNQSEIAGHLREGDIELFGLTYYSPADSSFEDYERWFNLALEDNPDVHLFVGHPQSTEGATTPSAEYEQNTEVLGAVTFQVVKQLRAAYPDNPVHYINYGWTATEMKHLYDADELPDILSLLPDAELGIGRDEALFTDNEPGHAGTMLQEVSALSWMELLYGADVESLTFSDYESDVIGIVNEVVARNEPFQHTTVGDYNGDTLVTAADYAAWRDASGQTGLTIAADGNGDAVVDEADHALWVTQFAPGLTVAAAVAIPEPNGAAIVGYAVLIAVSLLASRR